VIVSANTSATAPLSFSSVDSACHLPARQEEAVVGRDPRRFGHVDAVVCNTGHVAKGELLELTDAQWHEGLDMVLLSVIRLTRLVTPRR